MEINLDMTFESKWFKGLTKVTGWDVKENILNVRINDSWDEEWNLEHTNHGFDRGDYFNAKYYNRVVYKSAIQLITQEREEQLGKHGRSIKEDVMHNFGNQLSTGAAFLLYPNMGDAPNFSLANPDGWDVDIWLKMCAKPYKERLIIAAALLAAEIDRLIYLETEKSK